MDHKWDTSEPPQLLVLVQWADLQPEDSMWENWAELKTQYHLEDKVFLDDVRNDSTVATRPKRIAKKPLGWEDYIH